MYIHRHVCAVYAYIEAHECIHRGTQVHHRYILILLLYASVCRYIPTQADAPILVWWRGTCIHTQRYIRRYIIHTPILTSSHLRCMCVGTYLALSRHALLCGCAAAEHYAQVSTDRVILYLVGKSYMHIMIHTYPSLCLSYVVPISWYPYCTYLHTEQIEVRAIPFAHLNNVEVLFILLP